MNPQLQTTAVSQEQIAFALDNSFDQVVGYDRSLRIVYWNKSAEEWFNISRKDVIGKTIDEVFPFIKGDDRLNYLYRALEGEEFYLTGEKSTLREAYYKQKVLPWRDANGLIIGVLVIAQDFTSEILKAHEIKKLNEQLTEQNRLLEERTQLAETIIDTSLDFINVLDTELRIVAANKAYLEYIQKTSEEIIGQRILDLYPFLEGTQQHKQILAGLSGETLIIKDQRFSARDGYCDIYLVPLKNEKGEIFGLLTVTHDITERIQKNLALVSMNKELQQKNQLLNTKNTELETLTNLASTDFQEPINKIGVFTDLLTEKESDRLSDTGKDYLRRLNKSVIKIKELLNSLEYYHQLQNRSIVSETVDINSILSGLKEEVERKYKDIRFTYDLLPPVKGNRNELGQLFRELTNNSLQFRQPDKDLHIHTTYTISTREKTATLPQRTYLQITFSDNGLGFESDYRDKVFELFYKIHGNSEGSGKGVGLAICKKIVEKHKGSIEALSEPQKGVSMVIELPLSIN